MDIEIGTIPEADFYNYRLNVMFDSYKWDLQNGQQSTVCNKVVLIGREEMDFLEETAVSLYHETVAMERILKNRVDLVLKMGVSEEMAHALCACKYNPEDHIRMMRFDFHPTKSGWRISEVNSDVPAGYPEASILPDLAAQYFRNYTQHGSCGDVLVSRFTKLAPKGSTIAYLHDTHTVEDCQIMHYVGDLMEQHGYRSVYMDPSQIKWENSEALNIGAILRYYPVEWLQYEKGVNWEGFLDTKTPSCNHPTALLTQSKRLPLVWSDLGVDIPIWMRLLPETICTTSLKKKDGWILKPAFGRVGEGINIPGTVSDLEDQDIKMAAREHPDQWIAQRMFTSLPINGMHVNLGVFVIDGQYAGLYGRTSKQRRIDSNASEVPVLVRK